MPVRVTMSVEGKAAGQTLEKEPSMMENKNNSLVINVPPELDLRPLEPGDFVQGNFLQVLEELTEVGEIAPSVLLDRLAYMRSLPDTYFPFVLVDRSSRDILGTATLFVERKFIHRCGSVGHIEDVVVSQKTRRSGHGRLLLNKLTQIAREQCCYKVILDCDDGKVPFYEKCGYVRKGAQMARYFS